MNFLMYYGERKEELKKQKIEYTCVSVDDSTFLYFSFFN